MKSARTAGAPLRARTPGRRRWSPRLAIAGLLALALVALGGVAAFGVIVGTPNRGHMAAVGPVSSDNGFPAWYKDDTGVRVQPCLDDPKCAAVAGPPSALPDPSQPISFPDNFPDEFFYMLAASDFNIAGGGRAVTNLALEGAFTTNVADGQQMVFDRVRFFFGGLKAGAAYTITHPYGVDKIVAEQDPGAAAGVGRIRYTEDVGAGAGTFAQALNGRIGPFLKSTAAPAGYLGDGATAGPVTGSPYDTNFIRIEGPGVGAGVPAANQCPTPSADCIQSAAFTVEGKLATNGGVGVDRVTYSRKAGDTGGMVDVFANSDDATTQALQVTGSGFDPTLLEGEKGHYEARVGFTGAPPANVTVTNTGDVPVASKTVAVTDAITATAVYDTDKDTLTINASSSDQATSPTLTAAGFGDIPASGSLVVPNAAGAPANVTVTSAAHGTTTVPVTMTGAGFAAIPVNAFAGVDQEVVKDATVTLDGSGSTGPISNGTWRQTAGPSVTMNGADTKSATFVAPDPAPNTDATLTFEYTVQGSGGPSSDSVDVHVVAAATAPTANAGTDQTVDEDKAVALDGSGSSTETRTFAWKQVAGTPVTLSGAATAKPTFQSPKKAGTLTFELTASGAGGSSTARVNVAVRPDSLTLTKAQYTRATATTGEWRVEGTSTTFGPNVTVTITRATDGALVGRADVDTLGAWKWREKPSSVPSDTRVNIASSGGGVLTNQAVSVK